MPAPYYRHLLCVLVSFFAFKKNVWAKNDLPSKEYLKIIYLEPLPVIDIYNGSALHLGLELPFNDRFCFTLTGGYYFGNGYMGKAGVYRYWSGIDRERHAIGLEGFYKKNHYTIQDNKRIDDSTVAHPEPGDEVKYEMYKKVWGIHVVYKYSQIYRYISWGAYVGIGARLRDGYASISAEEQGKLYHFNESMIERFTTTQGYYWAPSLTAGVHIGFIFRPHKPKNQTGTP